MFSPNQIKELLDTIEFYHIYFVSKNIGTQVLNSEDIQILRNNGIDITKYKDIPLMNQAYKFGVLADALGDKNTKTLNFSDFKKYLKAGRFIPLTKEEEKALEMVKHQAYSDIKGLGNKVSKDLYNIYGETEQERRGKYEKIIEKELHTTILNHESVKDMVSRLGHKTQDWNRDFGRIADCLMHSAYEQGRAANLEEKGGKDVLVYKDVFYGSCRHCIKAYLTNGVGSQPRIFKLSELRANGENNIGRKPENWKPVLGFMHPFCRCTLQHLEQGTIWDKEKKSFTMPKEFERKVQRKSKIHITIGDKHFEV